MKKAAYLIVIIGLCLVINSLAHSIYNLWHKQDLLVSAQRNLALAKQKNQELKAKYKIVTTKEFVEEEAHDKLFMVRSGEHQVIITDKAKTNAKKEFAPHPNWQQWLDLFL